ncbi:MAG: pyridoxamine kinase [Oscillospiraceae bacterium]|nr:pyridoxamine kinase [Oscillospiraceae bacterium]
MKKIVSIQDISCYGQCSLTVALPILSAKGIETAILPSGILSTHTGGFQNFTYHDLTDEMPKIVSHWIDEGITFDAIYTGYIGDTRQFDLINDSKGKLLNAGGRFIVDPAMADHGKLYPALNEDIVEGMKGIVREADMILPNLTEAAFLLGREYSESYTRDDILDMLQALAAMGPEEVVLTGVSFEEGKLGAIAYQKSTGTVTEYYAEKQAQSYHGTGDIFSSVLIADYLNGKSMADCLADACEFIVKSIQATMGHPEHPYGVCFEAVLAAKE